MSVIRKLERPEIEKRAETAARLRDNADFVAMTAYIETDIFNAFRLTNVLDLEGREHAHNLIYSFDMMRKHIDKYIEAARFEQNKQNEEPK